MDTKRTKKLTLNKYVVVKLTANQQRNLTGGNIMGLGAVGGDEGGGGGGGETGTHHDTQCPHEE